MKSEHKIKLIKIIKQRVNNYYRFRFKELFINAENLESFYTLKKCFYSTHYNYFNEFTKDLIANFFDGIKLDVIIHDCIENIAELKRIERSFIIDQEKKRKLKCLNP